MEVHYDEGVATHIGPEPCAGVREGVGEASVGERIGQPLSRERMFNSDADAVLIAEGNTEGSTDRERPSDPAWSKTLACAEAPCAGTGRSHVRPKGACPQVRIGKARSRSR